MARRERMVVESIVRVEGGEGADIFGGWDDGFLGLRPRSGGWMVCRIGAG